MYQYQIRQDIIAVSGALLEEDDSGLDWEIFPLPQQSIRESKKVHLGRRLRGVKAGYF